MSSQVRVFVSHSHKDDAFTERLVNDLRAAGADVWVDSVEITHDDFLKHINAGLTNRQWVVLVMSPDSLKSSYVAMEVNAALHMTQQGRMTGVIPVIARTCREEDIPPLWATLHRYDATPNYSGALTGLLHAIGLANTLPSPAKHSATPAHSNALSMNTIPASFAELGQAFQPSKARGVSKTIQFEFSGSEAGTWHAVVSNGQFLYRQGPIENPNVVVIVESALWLKILRGKSNAVSAFMNGKIKIQGDMGVMMQFQSWFQRPG